MGETLQRILLKEIKSQLSLEGIIKFVCWQIWLARNKRIFKGKTISPPVVAINAIGQLSEFLSTKKKITHAGASMRTKEEAWLIKLNIQEAPPQCIPKNTPCWQLQYTPQEFTNWLNTQKSHVLCFDGASKGNPGEAGAEGLCSALEDKG
jgi:hypothetical protein